MAEKRIDKNLILCCIIFAVYIVLTLIGAATHELWFDEAQAWNIARDNDIAGVFRQLGYEGHPPLWYLILYIPAHLGLSCEVMPYISWFITGLAGALVMFRSPFHITVKSALLFSGGFLYVNSSMSRVYCLINLIIILIALLYPKRKEHPILYGVLIALLANTHVIMCGFIGILGIFMIIDLLKDFKTAGVKQNIKELGGLAIAGIGVLMLVVPLLNSLSLNNFTNENEITFDTIAYSFVESFANIPLSIISYDYQEGAIPSNFLIDYMFATLIAFAFVAMIILMRHKTRPFLILLFFWFFYIVTSEIVWMTIPSRALIFAVMFFVTAWISEYEPQNNAMKIWANIEANIEPKIDTKVIRKLLELAKRADKNYHRVYIVLITAVLIFSIPAAALYLFRDYTEPFCPSKLTAEYIRNNLPEDSVFISTNDGCAQISAYLPDYKFYSTDYGRFYTYCTHEVLDEEASDLEIYEDLKDYEHLYFMYAQRDTAYLSYSDSREEAHVIRGGMAYSGVNINFVKIVEYHLNPL